MIDELVATRRRHWERLEALLARSRGRGKRLEAAELEELGRLYRQSTSDLAIARRDFPRDRLRQYLEQLVGRAHPAVYQREAATWAGIWRFFTHGFPRAFREASPYVAVAFGLFAIPFAAAFLATLLDPLAGRLILPPGPLVDQIERGESWLKIESGARPLAASFIMTHNIQVAFFAFAGGVLVGLVTVYVLMTNGLQIGAVSGMASVYGLGGDLGSFVAAHGGVELTVVFIAGGAGLRLGHAILAPGLLTRRSALTLAARKTAPLLLGSVPLLTFSGLLEGFISPSALPAIAKLAVGASATVALYAYLLRAGRTSDFSRVDGAQRSRPKPSA